MNLNFSGLFQNQNLANQNITNQNISNSGHSGAVPNDLDSGAFVSSNSSRAIMNMMPGSNISGQVISVENGNVTIQLADESVITAALKGNVTLEPGSQVSFFVASNFNHQVTLSPLFTNFMVSSPSVEKALQAASLPINESSVSMVTQMMEQGMGIDKGSLQAMYRSVASNPNLDSAMIVRLSQMNLAINEMNAESLRAYETMNHQLLGSIQDITKEFSDIFSGISKENLSSTVSLFSHMVSLLSDMEEETTNSMADTNLAVQQGNAADSLDQSLLRDVFKQIIEHLKDPSILNHQQEDGTINSEDGKMADGKLTEANLADGKLMENIFADGKSVDGNLSGGKTVDGSLDEQINRLLQTLGKTENQSAKDVLKLVADLLQNKQLDAKILSEPSIGKLLQNKLEEQWLLKPEEVANKDRMESFYEQLRLQTSKLAQLAETVLGKDASLTQKTNQLSQNIDFMNQLNQTFAYVQIPLKMSGGNANGDLYVYTNKKNLASEDGSVSAYLHLDMEHLGSVDCYVTMQNEKVSTNFKVQDDSILDFLEQNIALLNERLEKRGYTLQATVSVKEEETSVIQEMEKQLGQGSVPISKVSFDARA
ncbi:MAG: flagellar hook-length control protein FliK [Lachnospiraceae bacterium]|nr:flagellar hook-length control protein FliK [Lachnospiraceae bacterium]